MIKYSLRYKEVLDSVLSTKYYFFRYLRNSVGDVLQIMWQKEQKSLLCQFLGRRGIQDIKMSLIEVSLCCLVLLLLFCLCYLC